MRSLSAYVAAALLALGNPACGTSSADDPRDAGAGSDAGPDAGDGTGDGGPPDDAAARDASPPSDGGGTDGAGAGDASPEDAGPPPGPLVLYVAPDGDDARSGRTEGEALATLQRANDLLMELRPERDVQVRIDQGTYTGRRVVWRYTHPEHTTELMPIDYEGGGIDSFEGRPLFDGAGERIFFQLRAAAGEPTNIVLRYLHIRGYTTIGVHLRGDRSDRTGGWNGSNTVYGCKIERIGNLHHDGDYGYGAIDLVNSRDNLIRNNHLLEAENASPNEGAMHGVYLAHYSSDNRVVANRFHDISGDPVKARDASNGNYIADNELTRSGDRAFYLDAYCDHSTRTDCTKASPECPSWRNEFRNNDMGCGYDGSGVSTFRYAQGETYVPPGCVDHAADDGWRRLRTSGNTKTCP